MRYSEPKKDIITFSSFDNYNWESFAIAEGYFNRTSDIKYKDIVVMNSNQSVKDIFDDFNRYRVVTHVNIKKKFLIRAFNYFIVSDNVSFYSYFKYNYYIFKDKDYKVNISRETKYFNYEMEINCITDTIKFHFRFVKKEKYKNIKYSKSTIIRIFKRCINIFEGV